MSELEPVTSLSELARPGMDADLFTSGVMSEYEADGNLIKLQIALERLDERAKYREALAPREVVTGTGDAIQNQEIDLIKDEEGLLVTFKLTETAWERVCRAYQEHPANQGYITYGHGEDKITTAPAIVVVSNNMEIKVAKPDTDWKALDGVVAIRPIQEGNIADNNQQTAASLKVVFEQDLGIEDPFNESDSGTEAAASQYAWHHKLSDIELSETDTPRLERRDVFDGYTTLVEPGKSREYESRYGEVANFHSVNKYHLADILRTGLASTQERYRRGCMAVGLNSYNDLQTGGADSVFVRTVTDANLSQQDEVFRGTIIVMNPSIMDRTDWYSYPYDHNGSTTPEALEDRLSPDELLAKINSQPEETRSNEQMFNCGIGAGSFMGIAVESPSHKDELITLLAEQGVLDCNGTTISDFIQVTESWAQVVDIAHGRRLRTLRPGEEGQIPVLTDRFGWSSPSELVF